MDFPYLNFPSGPHASANRCAQTTQSISQDFCDPFSVQECVSGYFQGAPQESYLFLGHNASRVLQNPMTNSTQSSHPSIEDRYVALPSSRSSHPYQQARLWHLADRTSARHQELSPPSDAASSVPFPTVDGGAPYNAFSGGRASNYCRDSNPLAAKKFAPAPTFASGSQYNIVAANAAQNAPSLMGSFTGPGQLLPTAYQMSALPPCNPVDQADVEYAQHRYEGKRCLYRCRFDLSGTPCNKWIVGDRTRVLRHLRNHHRLQTGPAIPAVCRWDKCTHSREMKQENLSRHIVMHLGVKWKCPHCRRLFSRDDAVHRHIERMVPGMDVTEAEVVPGREARAITDSELKSARTA